MKVVEVQWRDTCSYSEMMSFDDAVAHDPMTVTQVGYLLQETEDVITLVSEMLEDDFVRGITVIPRGSILIISKLGG